jgi:DHA2 family multidrug resistance protein-like MFS transporter
LLCAAGATLIAVGLASAAMVPAEAGPVWLAVAIIPCGVGFGVFQVPNNRTMFLSAPLERSAAAGGMQGTARLTGQTIGAVLMTLLFAFAPTADAPIIGMGLGAVFAVLAAGVSALQAINNGEAHRG